MRDSSDSLRQRRVFALFAGLLGFAVAAFAPQIFHDGDSWWHLAAGAWMLDHHAALKSDVFSFTMAGQPWDAQEWLSEVLMALSFRSPLIFGGWNGLYLLFGAATGAAAAIVTYYVCARTAALPALLISVIGLACISGSLLARPHLLALPLLALWTMELLTAREQKRAPGWWLLAVMLLWANLHGSFAFGLALAAVFALEAGIENRAALKGWSLFLISSIAAATLTPQLLHGLLFPFELLVMGSIRNIGEWAPTDLTHLTPFPIALVCLIYLGATGKLKLPPLRGLILLGLCYLALAHVRHQMLFGIVAPMLIAPVFASERSALTKTERHGGRAWAMAGIGLLALMVVARLLIPTTRGDDRVTPATALASLPVALRAQPVLNAYDFGGYLIFSGIKVFVDGRTDLYGDDFLARYDLMMKPDRKALSEALARWHIAWTILPQGPAATMMDTLPGWHRSYGDAFAVVHIKN
ncbi:MAG TPA: hypothetical protein VNW15_12195 [Rhizomicrobium sp.]|nr:hypothetical protein [Rhizomicrobium sp.]